MIEFKYVRWKNFLSTGNNFIEIQLDRNPTTLIIGENGAGKSTVLDALCVGLFGKPFRGINKPQLLNSVNGSSCLVEIEFKIGSKKIKVIRGIKPNIFEIYMNGKMYNQDANMRDYQKYLEQQILKLNWRSFTQVVILGSSAFIPFMQLKARHRREVVEEILDIQIFSLMNMILKQNLKAIGDQARDVKYNYELTNEKIELQENYIDEIKRNKDKLIAEKTALVGGNEEEVFKMKLDIDFYQTNNKELLCQIRDTDEVNAKQNKLKDIRSTLVEKKNSNSRMVEFFEEEDDCPTCEQHIDEKFKKNMISTKQKEVNKFATALTELEQTLNETINRQEGINAIADRIRENEVYLAKENSSVTQLERFNATLKSEVEQLQSSDVVKSDFDRLEELKENLSDIENQKSKLDSQF